MYKTEHAHLRAIESLVLNRFPELKETYECVCVHAYWSRSAGKETTTEKSRLTQANSNHRSQTFAKATICYILIVCARDLSFFRSPSHTAQSDLSIDTCQLRECILPRGVAFESFASKLARMHTYLSRANGISASTHNTAMLCTEHLVLICRMLKSVDMHTEGNFWRQHF